MSPTLAALPSTLGSFSLTKHDYRRMATCSISLTALEAALMFGCCAEVRGAQIFAIGPKEIKKYQRDGVEVSDFEGTQVVVTASGAVMRVYRDSDFKNLRTLRGCGFRR